MATTTKTLQVWWELASGIHWLVIDGEPRFRFATDKDARETGDDFVELSSNGWITDADSHVVQYVWL